MVYLEQEVTKFMILKAELIFKNFRVSVLFTKFIFYFQNDIFLTLDDREYS